MDVILKGYRVEITGSKHGIYDYYDLPEELCKKMVEVEDAGDRHSLSSRYTYYTKFCKAHNGIRFGSARAAVQRTLTVLFGEGIKWLKITEGYCMTFEDFKRQCEYNIGDCGYFETVCAYPCPKWDLYRSKHNIDA